jgi:glycosyltransferase involved in cell wall biosynthesis
LAQQEVVVDVHETMESGTRISVVTSLYNKGNCVERAIRSALGQTVPCSEILVVDDGSVDGGPGVVEGIEDPRIRLIRQANRGPAGARSRGAEEGLGELIAFLDADDEWKPWFLESIVKLRGQCPDAGAYATAYEIQEPDGRVWTPSFREIPPAPWEGIIPNFFRSSIGSSPVWISAVVIPKEVFRTVGYFLPCPGVGEDAELWARIAMRYPIAFSWRVSSIYHRDAENRYCESVFTHVFSPDCLERAMRGQHVPPHILPDVEEFFAHHKLVAASRYIVSGQPKLARAILKECRTRRFRRFKLWWWFWSLLPGKWVRLAWRGKRWLRMCFGVWS